MEFTKKDILENMMPEGLFFEGYVIPERFLNALTSTLSKTDVLTITREDLSETTDSILLSVGSYTAKLFMKKADKQELESNFEVLTTLTGEELAHIKRTVKLIPHTGKDIAFNDYIKLITEQGKLFFVATNGHVLVKQYIKDVSTSISCNLGKNCLAPKVQKKQEYALVTSYDNVNTGIVFQGKCLWSEYDNYYIFPDYEQVYPSRQNLHKISFDRQSFDCFSLPKSSKSNLPSIKFHLNNDSMFYSHFDEHSGEAYIEIYGNSELTGVMAVKARNFKIFLKLLTGDTISVFACPGKNTLTPICYLSDTLDILVMPVRDTELTVKRKEQPLKLVNIGELQPGKEFRKHGEYTFLHHTIFDEIFETKNSKKRYGSKWIKLPKDSYVDVDLQQVA